MGPIKFRIETHSITNIELKEKLRSIGRILNIEYVREDCDDYAIVEGYFSERGKGVTQSQHFFPL